MKNLFFLMLVLLWNGCCFDSGCDCRRNSTFQKLDSSVSSWIPKIDSTNNSAVFQNSNNEEKTFTIFYKEGVTGCGGDECTWECDYKKITYIDDQNNKLRFQLFGRGTEIEANVEDFQKMDSLFSFYYSPVTNSFYSSDTTIKRLVDNKYIWNSDTLTVLSLYNTGKVSSKYLMKDMIFSNTKGLIEFKDQNSETWYKIR